MVRLLVLLVGSVALCACGRAEPEMTRVAARPAAPTRSLAPGAHRLGLGRSAVPGFPSGRDGTLFVPTRARSGPPLPLLVLLHGGGGRADYFDFTFPLAEEAGVVVLTLDARDNTWDGIDSPFGPDVRFIDEALRHTFARVAIDASRVGLGGVSDGGSYSLSLGLTNGDLFTHLVAVAPGFINAPGPAVGRPRIYVAHGTRDNVYSVTATRRYLVPQLRTAGYEVTYEEFDGPHRMMPATVGKVFAWLQEAGGQPAPALSEAASR